MTNPKIPKGEGDAPVAAYLDALPGWQQELGREIDALVEATVPDVRKAVKWNQPLYGGGEPGWFLAMWCYTDALQLTFFNGDGLDPQPTKASKHPPVRYVDLHEDDTDLDQVRVWVEQAARLPGEQL